MDATTSAGEFMTGVAAWENPWPFEDVHDLAREASNNEKTWTESVHGGSDMLEGQRETVATKEDWTTACALDDLSVGAGTCVLVGKTQVAVFRVAEGDVRAVQNICPHKGAAAMHQGLVGERSGEVAVFCPLHKRPYSLDDGRCLDDNSGRLKVFQARIVDGMIEVRD